MRKETEKAKRMLESYGYALKLAAAAEKRGHKAPNEVRIIETVNDVLKRIPASRGKYYVEQHYIYGAAVDEICADEFISKTTYYYYVNPILKQIAENL